TDEGHRFAVALRAAVRGRTVRRRAAGGLASRYTQRARRQYVPHRGASTTRRQGGGRLVGHRQPRQRRGGPGGAEHEHHVRSAGDGRPGESCPAAMIRWIKQRFGPHARRVTVRTHMPWYLRWTARAFVAVSIAFLLWVAYEGGALPRWNSDDTDSRLEQARGENAEL